MTTISVCINKRQLIGWKSIFNDIGSDATWIVICKYGYKYNVPYERIRTGERQRTLSITRKIMTRNVVRSKIWWGSVKASVGGDRRVGLIGMQVIQGEFNLRKQAIPQIKRKIWGDGGEGGNSMIFESCILLSALLECCCPGGQHWSWMLAERKYVSTGADVSL